MVVEKVSYDLDWRAFKRGTSFFVPCLDGPAVRQQVSAYFSRYRVPILSRIVIENGIRGLRVWRM